MVNILVVDDEQDIVEMLETLIELDFEGVKVHKAYNGQEGIDLLISLQDQVDLVISDINMPVKKGNEVFIENQKNKNVPMMLMTGSDELEGSFIEQFKSANPMNTLMPKPWDQNHFLDTLKKILT